MGNLLFSPSGRIGPQAYFKGMMIIAVLGSIFSLLALVSQALGMVGGLASLVLFYCFFALTIKRTHDAGKSGWMSIVWLILFIIISLVIGAIVGAITGVSFMDVMNASMAQDMDLVEELTQKSLIPSAISNIVIYAVAAFVINKLNKSDPHENQFGPAT